MQRKIIISSILISWLYFNPFSSKNIENYFSAKDSCFYLLKVPPDLDVPTTKHFDTLIVRTSTCNVHVLKLPSWGTETAYSLEASTGNGKNYSRKSHFFGGHYGMIDITDLPAGTYSMSLMACGNGGGFTLRIK